MDPPPTSQEAGAIASAMRRRHNIMSAIQSSFGLSNDRVRNTITNVIVPETFHACCNWIRVKRSGGGGFKSGLNLYPSTDLLMMFNWWADYNLWAHFFSECIHQPQFGELENMAPEYRVFLKEKELLMLEVGAAGEERVQVGIKHEEEEQEEEEQEEEGRRLAGES